MAEAKARISMQDVRASVKRMQTEGEKLVGRIRKDAGALANRTRRETMGAILSDARKLQADLRKRAEQTLKELEARRDRILATIEDQAARIVERVIKGLNVVPQTDLDELRTRLADLERHIDTLVKERAA